MACVLGSSHVIHDCSLMLAWLVCLRLEGEKAHD